MLFTFLCPPRRALSRDESIKRAASKKTLRNESTSGCVALVRLDPKSSRKSILSLSSLELLNIFHSSGSCFVDALTRRSSLGVLLAQLSHNKSTINRQIKPKTFQYFRSPPPSLAASMAVLSSTLSCRICSSFSRNAVESASLRNTWRGRKGKKELSKAQSERAN